VQLIHCCRFRDGIRTFSSFSPVTDLVPSLILYFTIHTILIKRVNVFTGEDLIRSQENTAYLRATAKPATMYQALRPVPICNADIPMRLFIK
jgi:hypothetical protein